MGMEKANYIHYLSFRTHFLLYPKFRKNIYTCFCACIPFN